jgi:hypothetical protein
MAKQVKRTSQRSRRKSSIALPDEKSVRKTGASVGVNPPKVSRKQKERIAAAALDRRRQVIQTDEEKCEEACPPAKRKRR